MNPTYKAFVYGYAFSNHKWIATRRTVFVSRNRHGNWVTECGDVYRHIDLKLGSETLKKNVDLNKSSMLVFDSTELTLQEYESLKDQPTG